MLPLFFGCLLVALGPIFAVFCVLIAPSDQMVILTVGSSFFWLFAIMLSAIFWYSIPGMERQFAASIFVSVTIQEAFRLLFYYLYVRSERVLKPRTGLAVSAISNRLFASLAAGVGVAFMYTVLMYTSLLWEAAGPATLFSEACPETNLFIINALMALSFSLLHVFQSILAFDAYRQFKTRRGKLQIAAVVFSHYFASYSSMLNTSGASCVAAVIISFLITLVTGAACAHVVLKNYLTRTR